MRIDDLIALAKEEKWEEVDTVIPRISKKTSFVRWAYETGIKARNKNVRRFWRASWKNLDSRRLIF